MRTSKTPDVFLPFFAGFVAAYAVWSMVSSLTAKGMPKTYTNPSWANATSIQLLKKERVAGEPVLMNPLRRMA